MDGVTPVLILIGGLLIRLGIPIALTILVTWWLRRLDEHWKREYEEERSVAPTQVQRVKCWELMGCPDEQFKACPAYALPEVPCWQVFRSQEGQLREKCLDCGILKGAPVPMTI